MKPNKVTSKVNRTYGLEFVNYNGTNTAAVVYVLLFSNSH